MPGLPFDYSVRNLGRSPMRLGAIVLGSALVVGLVMAAGGFVRGMNEAMRLGGTEDNVLLLGAGSEESIERSEIAGNSGALVAASVQGIREANGVPYVSSEVNVALIMRTKRDDPVERRGVVRGVTPAAFLVHPQVTILSGRGPRSGANELLVGALAGEKLGLSESALNEGQQLYFGDRAWTIVGRFASPGTVMEGELWAPLTDVQVALKRDSISAVTVTLDAAEFADIDAFTKQRFDLELAAVRETDYYASLMAFYRPVRWMIGVTAVLVSLTGLFGGLNTLYAAFAARIREIGMLQTVGFTRGAVIWSLLQESLLGSAAGTLIAATAAIVLLDGVAVQFSLGVFALQVDGIVLLFGVAAGVALGCIGAIPPAVRCLRYPVAEALKAS